MTTTLAIQQRLRSLGFDPGYIDGIPGRMTTAAIAAFQKARGIDVKWPGTIGPTTMAALFPQAKVIDQPLPWLEEAKRHLGLREVAGPKHNATILKWLDRLKAAWRDDETAWCGTFVGWCIAATLSQEPLPAQPFAARGWLKFGVPCQPQTGAVMVFSRPGSSWSGHVGFYVGESASTYRILGGNQSNAVTETDIRRSRFLRARWPATVPLVATGAKQVAAGEVSTNEA